MYPVDVTADYGDGERSRGLAALGILLPLKLLVAIPHLIIVGVLGYVVGIIAWIGYWAVAFTGNIPEFFFKFPERVVAWQVRTHGWVASLTDLYPPFEWQPVGYAVDLKVDEQPGPRSRGIAVLGILFFLKSIALIPHVIVLFFVTIVAYIAGWIAFWVILFTGRYPKGIYDFVVGTIRWSTRLSTWLYTVTDQYPPFRLAS